MEEENQDNFQKVYRAMFKRPLENYYKDPKEWLNFADDVEKGQEPILYFASSQDEASFFTDILQKNRNESVEIGEFKFSKDILEKFEKTMDYKDSNSGEIKKTFTQYEIPISECSVENFNGICQNQPYDPDNYDCEYCF